jgi:hypothetical protein
MEGSVNSFVLLSGLPIKQVRQVGPGSHTQPSRHPGEGHCRLLPGPGTGSHLTITMEGSVNSFGSQRARQRARGHISQFNNRESRQADTWKSLANIRADSRTKKAHPFREYRAARCRGR